MSNDDRPIVLITGVAGNLGQRISRVLCKDYRVIGMDEPGKTASVPVIPVDLTDDSSVTQAFVRFRRDYGAHIASTIHLAAYFDFTGADNPLYHRLNVEGTRRVLHALADFDAEQFVYPGTMLVHAAVRPGGRLNETRRLDPRWAYPKSKAAAEEVIRQAAGPFNKVMLHLAGAYDEHTVVPTLAHQITRIYEGDLQSHVYPGDLATGQSMIHTDDLAQAFLLTVERRTSLPAECTILIGEADAVGYGEIQELVGNLVHGHEWATVRVPKTLAAAGAWVEDEALPHLPPALGGDEQPFVRPFMVWEADDHYALDITRARDLLGWQPQHHLIETLPVVVAGLQHDPIGWYKANDIGHAPPN